MGSSKLQQLTEHNEGILSWKVFGPRRLFRLPRNRSMLIKFQIVVQNNATMSRRVKVQFESPSPLLFFRKAESKRMSKSRLYARITMLAHALEHEIPAGGEARYDFRAEYAPHLTPHLPSELTLYYGVFIYNEKSEIQTRFGPRKIILPIAKADSPEDPGDDYIL